MSEVIKLSFPEPEIAVITMEEKEGRNTFTPSFVSGMKESFAKIEETPPVKVVITQGFGNYYACGATLEFMNQVFRGENVFTDLDFFTLPLTCKLPTIAAVQGHAVGGGLSFACLHDFIFLASGAIYSANFMKYGITPDTGATYTVPKRFGSFCGNQMLYTAGQYGRKELEELNCLLPFYSKEEVFEQALQLAKEISKGTLASIKLLKEQLSSETRQALPTVIENELSMQKKMVDSEEVMGRIKESYYK